jgi:hypothetical protein
VKKLLFLAGIVFVVFVIANRQRLFLRDPLASVIIGGDKMSGAQVYINYSNDVLFEHPDVSGTRMIVQHGEHAGTPLKLTCLHWVACLTDADVAPLAEPMHVLVKEMSGKMVKFRDESGRDIQVVLR